MTSLADDFAAILDGAADTQAITDFLIKSVDWMGDAKALAIGAKALRDRMVQVQAPPDAIDVCGTGGDGAHTLNVSTAVTFVVAGAGVPVAKHGNRAMSSKTGAADVLEALGVHLLRDPAVLAACLAQTGVAFLFAQLHHPCMGRVAAARKALGHRTIFNLLGPLANPCGVKRQLVGVFDPAFANPMAQALVALGSRRALVVHGAGGLDELATDADNHMIDATTYSLNTRAISMESLGIARHAIAAIAGGDAADNAHALRTLLTQPDRLPAYRDIVLLNAAAAFLAAGAASLEAGVTRARESLFSGAALDRLDHLIAFTKANRP